MKPLQLLSGVGLCLVVLSVANAQDSTMQLSEALSVRDPKVLKSGQCVRYEEGGKGFSENSSSFWLEGQVIATRYETRTLATCPLEWTKSPGNREELLRREAVMPCIQPGARLPSNQIELALVEITVRKWETPWDRVSESSGRLYRGHYLDRALTDGGRLWIDGALLKPCAP